MIKHTRLLLALLSVGLFSSAQQTPAAIIPEPVSTQWHSGSFHIYAATILEASDSDILAANFFNDYLQRFYGVRLKVLKGDLAPAAYAIVLRTQPGQGPDGRYTLESTQNGVIITGSTHSGTFYGIQTLIQLLPTSPFQYTPHGPKVRAEQNGLAIPAVSVLDYPRFAYRGLHLDVSRHFFPVDFVKRYIDFIALHKMNYFHWHLTDDQGWRIEIKKYPRLTEVGAWRSGTIIGHFPGTGNDSTEHGGYYTQDQVKEVVKYAADRYITVIPEIEMPGHASAALAAYPWLGCTGGPYHVQQTFGVFNDVYCAGKDSVFRFLEDVLDEVMPLFPCKYVHIGGDECPKESWKHDPKCQQRMKELGLKTEDQLQSWFIQRIEKYVNSKGKQIIGWDEILEGGIAPNATIMSWRGEQGGIDAAKQHHDVIMTPGRFVYFDHAQTHNDDSLTIGGYLPLDTVYSYEPIPAALKGDDTVHVLGAQANLWTEYVSNVRKVEYMLFPRLSALSEVLWSPKAARNYTDFQNRLAVQYKRYALWGVDHYDVYFKPDSLVRQKVAEWQDRKFGLLMHWGTYSQWGIVESWSICPEDEGWTQRRGPYSKNYYDYLHAYENLKTTFNPTRFDPSKWATAAAAAGMKYVVFTTKHHDGFCMFDTKQTDYKITSTQCPFSSNPKSNVAKEVFDAFRKDNFLIGAYFSKPDWHSDNYWWSYFPPKDRNVNYDPARYPDRWTAFKDYTYKQIEELMTGYGRMDLLWLDGGWVRPLSTVNPGVDWQRGIRYDQDVDMPKIAAMARSHQPGLIVVDRSVPGPYENYTTPEQQIPAHPMDDPWETCMTMGDSWSYVPHDHYKSSTKLVQLLVKIVSRGGNFLLNVGPSPEGDFDDTAYARLKEIGAWIQINGEGIYNSRPVFPWSSGKVYLTQAKNGSAVYAFLLSDNENPEVTLPASVTIDRFIAKPKSLVTILGRKEQLHWKQEGKKMIIEIPANLQGKPAGQHAVCFRIGS